MKKLLLGLLITLISFGVTGQSQFKQVRKNPAGTVKTQLKFVKSTAVNQKAVTSQASIRQLSLPLRQKADRPLVSKGKNGPVYIERTINPMNSQAGISAEEKFYRFLESTKNISGILNPRESFRITARHTDDLGITHIRSVQQYKGIEVYGTESTWHLDAQKERFTGSFFKLKTDIDVKPLVTSTSGISKVMADLKKNTVVRDLNADEKKLLHYDAPTSELIIVDKGQNEYRLAWVISVRPNLVQEWKYFIDARTGEILRKYNNTQSDGPTTANSTDLNNVNRSLNVYLEQGTYYLINMAETMYNNQSGEGMIMTLDANNTSTVNLNYNYVTCADNLWSQKQSAVSAHYNAKLAYSYFLSKFGRNSLNGQGGNIISLVNVADEDGGSMENAFWNGQAIFYGNGGSYFKSLAGGLDVAAHELGHGVVSNTANLEYQGQSGAINESFADIFGIMVDREDWLIGEDVVKPAHFPSGALRSMADPHNGGSQTDMYWQPAHLSEMYLGSQDNGGVHINSGIPNRAFYLFATAVGKDKAEQVYYRALAEYLTKTSQFIDLRIAVVQAAKDLYGNSSNEAVKAGEAFDVVGIQEDSPVDVPDEYNTNPGPEYLLMYNTDPGYSSTIYAGPTSGTNYQPYSSAEIKRKVSVTDDGSVGVYVGTDDRIYVLSLDPENPLEQSLSDEQFFDNVAVSRDGNRIAAISTEVDTSIYVYDFGLDKWNKFKLYNPTTSEVNAGGVLYADAIEFDPSGEYVIYDAYNQLYSSTEDNISYWDVGFMKVWDNHTSSFGDGSILKLFTSLPENVSVGNPVFSKNSGNIIAFDYYYYDGTNEEFGIYGANLETGDLQYITPNTTLGFPSFSKNDDKLAFTVLNTDEEDIYTVPLENDRITPAADPQLFMEFAKWPVYYAVGTRVLGLPPVANFTADYKTGGAPLVVKFVDLSENEPTSWQWTFQGGTPSSSTQQNPQVTYSTNGTYRVTLKATNSVGNNTLNREGYIVVGGATPSGEVSGEAMIFYPNPVTDKLNIHYNGDFSIALFNTAGKLILSAKNQSQVDLSPLSKGLYIMELKTKEGTTRHKIVKE
ncbi:MAG TPA: M4 family metallopeptidase [Bacteroidales bacterium]|nr:M4 family metallopeptidase [Bacteroidales bacterium]